MSADDTQDNPPLTTRTGLRTTDEHCSWRDVYARLNVDPSIDGTATYTPVAGTSSRSRDDSEQDADDDNVTVTV